jgi:Tol biopolymer transport system component
LLDLDTLTVKPLLVDDTDKTEPVWSPDGKYIAYQSTVTATMIFTPYPYRIEPSNA